MSDINCVKQVLQSRTNPTIVSWKGGAVSQLPLPCYVFLMFDLPQLNTFWDFYSGAAYFKLFHSFIWLLLPFKFYFVHRSVLNIYFLWQILGILDFGRDAWIHREDWIQNGIHIRSGRKYKDSYFLQAQAMCYINLWKVMEI